MSEYHSSFPIYLKVVIVCLANLTYGYGLAYYSVTQNTITYVLGFQDSENRSIIEGLINALLPIGGAIGSAVSCNIPSNCSQIIAWFEFQDNFLITDSIEIIAALASMLISFPILCFSRFLLGFVMGVNIALDQQYIQSISPPSLSGIIGAISQIIMLMGITVAFALQWIFLTVEDVTQFDNEYDYGLTGYNNWRCLLIFPAIPSVIRFIAFLLFYTQQLPREYLTKNQQIEAYEILSHTYYPEQAKNQVDILLREISLDHGEMSLMKVFKNRRKVLVCLGLSILNQWAGINAVNFYAATVLEQMTNRNQTYMNATNIGNGLVSVSSAVVCGQIINKFGRRIMLLVGVGSCAVSLTIITAIFIFLESSENPQALQITSLVFLFVFIISYSSSLGPIFWIYITEVLPPKGIDFIAFTNWIALAMLAQVFPIVSSKLQLYYNFAFFAIICYCGEFMIYKYVIETRGLRKSQINSQFKGQSLAYVDINEG